MNRYYVTAPALNLRSGPNSSSSDNIIGRLPYQTRVEVLQKTTHAWWFIKTVLGGLEGYVFSKHLDEDYSVGVATVLIKKAEFEPHPESRLSSKAKPAWPIGGSIVPKRNMTDNSSKVSSLGQIVETLNAEKSYRYQRTPDYTFCNVYAYDFCFFAGVYIPRVWWYADALQKLQAGEEVEPIYGATVGERRVNFIHDWFLKWGNVFGWKTVMQVNELQTLVNTNGGIGIICAKNKVQNWSGHITIVVPETSVHKAYRVSGITKIPLQSQAGAINLNYFASSQGKWWLANKFSSFLFLYHD